MHVEKRELFLCLKMYNQKLIMLHVWNAMKMTIIMALFQINLDSKTRLLTANNMSSPNRQTFEIAQKRIQALMEKDSYRRFLQSDVYLSLLGDHRHKLNLTWIPTFMRWIPSKLFIDLGKLMSWFSIESSMVLDSFIRDNLMLMDTFLLWFGTTRLYLNISGVIRNILYLSGLTMVLRNWRMNEVEL